MNTPDFKIENHRSIYLVRPAREHLEDHVSPEALWFGGDLAVEPRYIRALAKALGAAGFEVR